MNATPKAFRIGFHCNGRPHCCNQAWLLKKSLSPKNDLKFRDRKCLPASRKSLVSHPDAIDFLQISKERVFQHPQAISLRTDFPVVGEMAIFRQLSLKKLTLRLFSDSIPKRHTAQD
jgi:hypothetical protein